jgi:hypothetical protein
MSIHYALRPEVDKDTFLGGVLAAGDTDIDVLAALQEGGGLIEIADDDHLKAAVLDGYQPLERVAAPEQVREVAAQPDPPAPTLATDGEPIEIPDGVTPGETPGWPVDAVTGAPLRLTDEQRQKVAATPLDKQPETVRELLEAVGITPPADAGRGRAPLGGRRSTTTEKES